MIYFLITIISLLVGYWLGKSKPNNEFEGLLKMIADGKKLTTKQLERAGVLAASEIPTGQIKPKTAEDIAFIKRPQKEKEGLDAMRETLSKIPKPTEKDTAKFYG